MSKATKLKTVSTETSTKFTDSKGREWDISINLAAAKRADASDFEQIGYDNFSILNPTRENLMSVLTDPALMFAVIWAIIQPQVRNLHASGEFPVNPDQEPEKAQEEFCEGIRGNDIESAKDALTSALGDFFPGSRTVLSSIRERMKKAKQRLSDEMEKMLPEFEGLVEKQLDEELLRIRREVEELKTKPGQTS